MSLLSFPSASFDAAAAMIVIRCLGFSFSSLCHSALACRLASLSSLRLIFSIRDSCKPTRVLICSFSQAGFINRLVT